MELISIESSKVVYLHTVNRPQGQTYLPDLLTGIAGRYSFVKRPTLEELLKREMTFAIGKFQDIGIQDFSIYSDGVIVNSASDTDKLIDFINDLFSWARDEFGVVANIIDKPETSFESTVIIQSNADLTKVAPAKDDIGALVKRAFKKATSIDAEFVPTGFLIDVDVHGFPGRRKPINFGIERRLNVPFEQNVFYCRAPLPTKAHLELLRTLDDLCRG
jgi:hypothetical protein